MSMSKPISILIWGPGRGHNITYALDYFDSNDKDKAIVYFLTQKYSFQNNYNKLITIDYYHPNKILRRFKLFWELLKIRKIDILYIQGETTLIDLFIIVVFGKFRKRIFNVWSEYVIRKISGENASGKFYRLIFNRIDLIHCNWYSTFNKLVLQIPDYISKSIVLPWGLKPSFFVEAPPQTDFIKNFVGEIEQYATVILNLRSVADYNAIEVLLDALLIVKKLNKEVYDSTVLLFWHGNNVDDNKEKYILSFIDNHSLQKHVKYVNHPFVPESDISYLIKNADIIVNLVKHDQLSTSVLEAIYLKKDQLMSDIEPYRILNEKYNFNLKFVGLKPELVAEEIVSLAAKHRHGQNKNDDDIKLKRSEIVKNEFSMKNNFDNIYNQFSQLLEK